MDLALGALVFQILLENRVLGGRLCLCLLQFCGCLAGEVFRVFFLSCQSATLRTFKTHKRNTIHHHLLDE